MSLARLHGKRIIIYTQGRMVLRPAYREHLRSFILSVWGAAWITPLRFDDDDLEEAHPRTFYVPFVAPPCQPRARPFPKKDQPIRVLSIGKYVPRKSHTLLVEAMEPSLAGGRATLTLAGEVSSHAHRHQFEAVREAVSSRGLDHAVDFVTNLPFDQTPQLYQSADVFVLPSRDEPAAVSVVEAMSFGLPVVCSTTNGTRCYIQDGYNGFVFRSGDAQALGETLEPLIEDRALLAKLSRHAYVTAAGPLSATAYLQHMSEITRPSEDP
jgi:glycosyltransferase involved in cell wall biosynthesis